MQVDLEKYIDNNVLKTVIVEEMREIIRDYFSEDKVTRLIGNISYEIVYKMVDNTLENRSLDSMLAEKVKNSIESLTTFHLFQEPNVWSKNSNYGYKIMDGTLRDNTDKIKEIVSGQIEPAIKEALQGNLKIYIFEAITNTLFEKDKNKHE